MYSFLEEMTKYDVSVYKILDPPLLTVYIDDENISKFAIVALDTSVLNFKQLINIPVYRLSTKILIKIVTLSDRTLCLPAYSVMSTGDNNTVWCPKV